MTNYDSAIASPAFDAVVSELIFKKPYRLYRGVRINGKWIDIQTWMPEGSSAEDPPGGMTAGNVPPRYTSLIVEAWSIIERFRPYAKLDARGISRLDPAYQQWCCSIWVGGPEVMSYGRTASLAICRAAVKATMVPMSAPLPMETPLPAPADEGAVQNE